MFEEKLGKAISASGISKSFLMKDVPVQVIKHIDISIDYGSIVIVTGPSGSGKTTLVTILSGLLKPEKGAIHLMGEPIHRMKTDELSRFRREHIGFIFQHFNLLKGINLTENVSVPLLLKGVSERVAREEAKEALSQLGLEDKFDAKPESLSGGEKQRAAIARALVHEPSILFCDEPTASLDTMNSLMLMEILLGIAKLAKKTVVIITHDNRIFKYADRIIFLEDGVFVREEPGGMAVLST